MDMNLEIGQVVQVAEHSQLNRYVGRWGTVQKVETFVQGAFTEVNIDVLFDDNIVITFPHTSLFFHELPALNDTKAVEAWLNQP